MTVRPPRTPKPNPRCDVITDVLRAVASVPIGARWCVSWGVKVGDRERRLHSFYLADEGARKWCEQQGIVFPGVLLEQPPMSSAHDPDWGVVRAPAPTGEASTVVDFKARSAGDD